MSELEPVTREEFLAHLPERDKQLADPNKQLKGADILVGRLHNFTIVTIIKEKKVWAGVSKRDPETDQPNEVIGYDTASVRAWRDLIGKPAGYGRKRTTSIRAARKASLRDTLKNAVTSVVNGKA